MCSNLRGMQRMQVEVRDENEEPLRDLAFRDHRSVREQASYLLNQKIQQELVRLQDAVAPVAEVA